MIYRNCMESHLPLSFLICVAVVAGSTYGADQIIQLTRENKRLNALIRDLQQSFDDDKFKETEHAQRLQETNVFRMKYLEQRISELEDELYDSRIKAKALGDQVNQCKKERCTILKDVIRSRKKYQDAMDQLSTERERNRLSMDQNHKLRQELQYHIDPLPQMTDRGICDEPNITIHHQIA